MVQEKTGSWSVPQTYAFDPLTAVLDPGGVPLTCTDGDSTGGSCLYINTYGAMNSMHSYWGKMELMVMM